MSPASQDRDPPENTGPESGGSFVDELKKRQVFSAAGAYAAVAWGVTEILDGVVERFGWPDWIATLVVIVFVTGFPVAMFLAWVFDWRDGGIHRDEPWSASSRLSLVAAVAFLVAGSGALFWLINPSGVVRLEQTGIAVQPCRYRGDPEQAFRAHGYARILNDRLAQVPALRVPSFSSVTALAARTPSIAQWQESANLTWLVVCRLVQDARGWTWEASVIDVANDLTQPLINLEDPDAIRVDALEQTFLALLARLDIDAQAAASSNHRYPRRVASLDAYLQAEYFMEKGSLEAYHQARALFRDANESAGMSLALIRQADAWMFEIALQPPHGSRQLGASIRAITLMLDEAEIDGPSLPELFVSRMRLALLEAELGLSQALNLEQMDLWFEKALALRPSYAEPYTLRARALKTAGLDSEARKMEVQARELAPGA